MEVNWKEFWKKFWSFTKKVDAEESAVANTIAFLLFFSGFGVLIYGLVNHITWALIEGILSLVIGAIIFHVNTTLAQCKVAGEEDKNHPQG